MKNSQNKPDSVVRSSPADSIFEDFHNGKGKGIFARIPKHLHDEVLEIKAASGKSLYEIVEKALKLFVAEYKIRKSQEDRKNLP